jgi:predicted nucleotidyltransferase
MTTYNDISTKIDPAIVEVLSCIKDIADKLGIPFFLVGAKARDLFFSLLFDIQTTRATLDIDLGIKVNSWDEVSKLINGILSTSLFSPVNNIKSRFKHNNGTLIDIVPFGMLEKPIGKIQWPTEDAIMTTNGFEEAYEYSQIIRIRTSPILDIRVCTPPAMVMLKLIAWNEKYPERAKDAQDIEFILKQYIDAGNDSRLHGEDKDLLVEGFDYEKASARILGRDIAKIATAETISVLLEILERETNSKSEFRLITDMLKGRGSFEDLFATTLSLLRELQTGISENPGRRK